MEEKKNIFQNKKLLLIIPVLLVVAVIGVTYAFFNYTRTGEENTVGIGRIAFNTDQNNDTLTLTNVFPSSSVPVNADSVSVHITGDTTYDDGEEFQVTLVNVVNTVNGKTIPINYVATYTLSSGAAQGATIGTSKSTDDAYFTDRGSTTTVYKLTSTGEVSEGTEVLKGYITSGATGIDGTLTIQAYLDSSKILISDTIADGDIEASGYVNGTPGAGMTVLTTTEWNSIQGSPLSFKVKVEAKQGIWIVAPALPAYQVISSLSGLVEVGGAKRYVGTNPNNYVIFNNEQWRIIGLYGTNLKIIKAEPLSELKVYEDNPDANTYFGNSDLDTWLNQTTDGGYYNSLNSNSKEMIVDGIWYAGKVSHNNSANEAYTASQTASVTRKVGLIASYEYLYAANDNSCYGANGSGFPYINSCASKDWLLPNIDIWTISVDNDGYNGYVIPLKINSLGSVDYGTMFPGSGYVAPVVYLNSGVNITGGTGESGGNEYTLSYTAS